VKLVLLTDGGSYGLRIAAGLALREAPLYGVVIVRSEAATAARQNDRRITPRRIAVAALRRGLRLLEPRKATAPATAALDGLAPHVRTVVGLNTNGTIATLREMNPMYVLLGGVGILKTAILEIPTHGTINVHPALLPWCRGTGVVGRSVERGIPVGVTAHFVDPGIDTGPIIRRELIPVTMYDTLTSLEAKADERSVALMVEVMLEASRATLPRGREQTERTPYCRWASTAERAAIDAKVRSGVARELYYAWRRQNNDRLELDPGFAPAAVHA
jgi:methionyl-tRNA formyltransferase